MKRIDIRYIYAIHCWAYPLRVKIGISDAPRRRARELKTALSNVKGRDVDVFVACAMPLFFARTQEGTIHRRLSALSAEMPDHSGQTEWFYHANPITAGIACLAAWYFFGVPLSGPVYCSAALLSAVLFPADAALLVIGVFLWEVKWVALAVFLLAINYI